MEQQPQPTPTDRNNRRTLMMLAGLVVLMFGFAFALVPLYKLVCSVAGINGIATNSRVAADDIRSIERVDKSRVVTVQFDATLNANLDWEFKPAQRTLAVHPGEIAQISFFARNNTDQEITAQSVPGVTPWQASEHFKKLECFCFDTQTLAAGESVEMPLQFAVDPALPAEIETVTLSYTIMNINRDAALKKGELAAVTLAKPQ